MGLINVDTGSRKEQRKFGIVMGVAIAVLGVARWALHGFEHLPVYFFAVGAVLFVLGLIAPKVLQPVLIVWIKIAEVLNWILTHLFLMVVFYGLITPTRLIIRLFSEDPLKRAWRPKETTYWEEAEAQSDDPAAYRNQF
ncbi:MAG TPA: SxtJ family membrane protein [Candidatus Hydrogenedentes bacterium]|nr:SxtJ family membrane protein [Candidatus Hydrogenedentota bacterium]